MKKKIFYLFTAFVGVYMVVAWHFAAVELVDLEENPELVSGKNNTELVSRE